MQTTTISLAKIHITPSTSADSFGTVCPRVYGVLVVRFSSKNSLKAWKTQVEYQQEGQNHYLLGHLGGVIRRILTTC